jgi:hypothetical protein
MTLLHQGEDNSLCLVFFRAKVGHLVVDAFVLLFDHI